MSEERFRADLSEIREFITVLQTGEATQTISLLVIHNIVAKLDLLAEIDFLQLNPEPQGRFLTLTSQIKDVLQGINADLFTQVRIEKPGDRYTLVTEQLNQLSKILNFLQDVPQLLTQLEIEENRL